MHLDPTICSRARLARDPRFDGRFFIGVLTTGVYCRPICPVRAPKEENVRYFPTAAAAAAAGLRPCLRCRPECSPGTPAWLGSSATISRALRLIGESDLEDGGIDALAQRLGIGPRHLRRLFMQYLGSTPIAVVQTRRLHFAKKLIDETRLPMNQVAMAAGFGSIRRFNAAFQKTYARTPTQIRKLTRRTPVLPEHEHSFLLRYRTPFCWDGLLEFIALRAIPGVEVVEHGSYRRIFALKGSVGWLTATNDEGASAISLRIHFPDPRWLFLIVERVRRMFDLTADPNEIAQTLAHDPVLAGRIATRPGLRVPGCWDGFELAVRAILGQQVTVRGATTLAGRVVREFGDAVALGGGLTHLFPTPEKLARADVSRIGLPRARAESIHSFAQAVLSGAVTFAGVANIEKFISAFLALPGIGDWTAQYVCMRAFSEPDAFPSSDLGLLRASQASDPRQLETRARAWRPWRAYAAMYLWQGGSSHEQFASRENRQPARAAVAGSR